MDKALQKIVSGVCVVGGLLFGKPDGLLYALLLMMTLDYVSGVLYAASVRRLSSGIGFRGLCRKLLILVLVAVGHTLDSRVLAGGALVRSAVESFYIANEGLSILENVGRLGLPLPARLRRLLLQLQKQEEETHE